MNNTFALVSLLFFSACTIQSKDKVIFKSDHILLSQNPNTNNYKLAASETYDDLLFAKQIYSCFQILDGNHAVFFIGEEGEKKEEVQDFYSVCGTVEHYELSVKKSDSNFEIFEDETYFDRNNEEDAVKTDQISSEEADSILFINGKSEIKFTSNFDIGIGTTDPRMLILMKDGKYFTQEAPNLKYDSIDFSKYIHSLKTKRGNLYGLLGIVEPQYTRIEDFRYYLAEAETENGEVMYIDIEGNEYKSAAKKK